MKGKAWNSGKGKQLFTANFWIKGNAVREKYSYSYERTKITVCADTSSTQNINQSSPHLLPMHVQLFPDIALCLYKLQKPVCAVTYVSLFLLNAGDEAEIDLSGKYQTSLRKDDSTQTIRDSLSIYSVEIQGSRFTEPGNCFAQILFWSVSFPRKCSTSINMLLVSPSIINPCVLQRAHASIFSPVATSGLEIYVLWSPVRISNNARLHPLPLHLKLLQCQTASHHHH